MNAQTDWVLPHDAEEGRAAQAEARQRLLESELAAQRSILEQIASGLPLDRILHDLCRRIEVIYPGAICSVLRLDRDEQVLRHAASPSMPIEFSRSIDGLPVGDGHGACGQAAARNQTTIVEDIATDPMTVDFVALAEFHHLRSVWSLPLTDSVGDVTGTFAVYRHVPHVPDADEIRHLQDSGSLVAIALERERAERALTAAAQLDPLTRLPNRAQFLARVTDATIDPSSVVAILFLDLDGFKWINDSLGHTAGDEILVGVADRLRDALGPNETLSRFGGDEFTILVRHATAEIALEVAGRVEATLAEPVALDDRNFYLSASIGIALNDEPRYAGSSCTATDLVRDADAAMYAAKEQGRARHAVFDQGLRDRALERLALESDMRDGMGRGEFVLHYQPIVELVDGYWTGIEALVRWQHPTRGLVMPDAFIELAEETGLILRLGAIILDRAIEQAAGLLDRGLRTRVSVNISAVQLSDPALAGQVSDALTRHQFPPDLLLLEVTESSVMARFEIACAALTRLTELGVSIAIDDFGTGYSSIARLGELPAVGLKIDRSFTMLLGTDPAAERVLVGITGLAHAFGLRVVAEGIETLEALAAVRRLGCNFGQGYVIARPAPLDQIEPLLRAHGRPATTG